MFKTIVCLSLLCFLFCAQPLAAQSEKASAFTAYTEFCALAKEFSSVFVGELAALGEPDQKTGKSRAIVRRIETLAGKAPDKFEFEWFLRADLWQDTVDKPRFLISTVDVNGVPALDRITFHIGHMPTDFHELEILRRTLAGAPPQAHGVVLVKRSVDDYDLDKSHDVAAGAIVIAEKDGQQFFATTDRRGGFAFDDLPDGDYKVSLQPSAALAPANLHHQSYTVKVGARPTCQQYLFLLTAVHTGRIGGKVLDAPKDHLRFLEAVLTTRNRQTNDYANDNHFFGGMTSRIAPDGNYEFSRVPPGEYFVYITRGAPPGEHQRATVEDIKISNSYFSMKAFYPNAPAIEYATPINLRAGEQFFGADISLNLIKAEFDLTGEVRLPDGGLASNAIVMLRDLGAGALSGKVPSPGGSEYGEATTDENGKFTIAAPLDHSVRLFVYLDAAKNNRQMRFYNFVEFKAVASAPPLKLILERSIAK